MRIAEVAEFYAPNGGGVRTYIDRKFQAAERAGHALFVLAPAARDGFEPRGAGGVVWIRAPVLPFDANYRLFWDVAPVHAALDRLAPDFIEASSPWRGAWIAAGWPGAAARALFMHADPVASYPQRWLGPLIGGERVDRLFDGFWRHLGRLSDRFDVTVAGSHWLAERLSGQGLARVEAVPLGIDRGVFSPARRSPALRAELLARCQLPPSAGLLVAVGRHHAEKRWPMVIEAVAAAGAVRPLGLVLIGDGMSRSAVQRAAGANPHIRLVAPIKERAPLSAILASADALIHGGESETFGLVAAEALASGTPLVTPDRGGCADLADPRFSERFAARDARGAADAVLRLFARDPLALRAAAGLAAVRGDDDHFADLFRLYGALSRQAPHSGQGVAA